MCVCVLVVTSRRLSHVSAGGDCMLWVYVTAITSRHLKYVSLVVLAIQNAALIIVMRYVRTRPGDMFASTTAVVMTEIVKVVTCLVVIWYEEGSVRGCCSHLNENIIQQPWDSVRVSVPAFLYMIQNNLIYVAATNLDAATFQVNPELTLICQCRFFETQCRYHT